LDTNILISSLLRNGLTRDIISVSPFKMYTVLYAKIEMEKHKDELLSKSKLDEKSFGYLKEFIFGKINFIPLEDLAPFKDKAIEVMHDIDIDDSPFLALAMSLNCPIWSNDGHFKRQDVVKAFTTRELMNLL
ncbi:MAG: PIN domain-containing protein, partial [Methanothrix sp.]